MRNNIISSLKAVTYDNVNYGTNVVNFLRVYNYCICTWQYETINHR